MKTITYTFADGHKQEIEVSDEIAEVFYELEKYEKKVNRKETRRHTSLQMLEDEGFEFVDPEADSQFRSKLDEYYLAVNMYRLPLYPHTVGHWLKTFEEEHHFRYVSCHGLRHTYCSLLLSQNVPIQTVSKYMGHSDSTVTLKVYSHFIPDTQDKALNALAKLAV